MSQPEVSIIIPTYNEESYINDCLASIYRQSFSDYEIIAIDDGSTDNTQAILKRHSKVQPLFIPHTGNPNIVRNIGESYASGKYLFFCDGDIILTPEALSMLYNALVSASTSTGYAYGRFKIIDSLLGREKDYGQPFDAELLRRTNYISGSSLIKRSAFNEVRGWDEKIVRLQDWDLWLTLLEHRYIGLWVDGLIFTSHIRDNSISDDRDISYKEAVSIIHKKHGIEYS